LGKIKFADLISTDKEKKEALSQLESQIKQFCQQTFLQNFGIKLRDVRFTRFNFPGQNKASIFNRMKAERGRIATKYRSEGEGEAIKIKAAAEKEKRQILARADREARELRGEGEAEAAAIYRKAYASDPEFYKFLRTLDAYEKFIDENTTVILPQDSDLLKLLVNGTANQSKKR
jgi:membrane protease subunit HflC